MTTLKHPSLPRQAASFATAVALSCTTLVAPEVAASEPAETEAANEAEDPQSEEGEEEVEEVEELDPEIRQKARQLFLEGASKYETADFPAAIEKFSQAYALVPPSEAGEAIRNTLVHNLAKAHIKAYDLDRDVVHLRTAKLLLEGYLKNHQAIYQGERQEETQESRDTLAEIERRLKEIEDEEKAAKANAQGQNNGPSGPQIDTTAHRPLMIGGALGLVAGAAGIGIGTSGALLGRKAETDLASQTLAQRPQTIVYGNNMNTLAYIGAAVGVVGVAVGATFLALGIKKKKEIAEAQSARRHQLSPMLSRSFSGAAYRLEF